MFWLYIALFGAVVGLVGFAAAYCARKKPVIKLFGSPVQTERAMDVAFLVFLILANVLRGYFFPGYWEKDIKLDLLAAVCVIAPAVLILVVGDRLILRKRFPADEGGGGIEKV
ncbi:MAG: hypothetical protein K6G56_01970 [Clostridiales bacterium]|nr:hypothetical protein [Clostridiales bacterium]